MSIGKGLFGYFDLYEWYVETFSEEEKNEFKSIYKNDEDFEELVSGNVLSSHSPNQLHFLFHKIDTLIWHRKFSLALKFIQKSEEVIGSGSIVEKHFYFSSCIKFYDDSSPFCNQKKKIEYCIRQIEIGHLASKLIIDKELKYKISSPGYNTYYKFLNDNNQKEEAKKLRAKARKEKWNCNGM